MDERNAGRIARERLTDKTARQILAPAEGYLLLRDGGPDSVRGLALRITCPTRHEPEGARAWLLCYRNKDGRERRMTIGRCADWPIRAARDEAKRLRRIADGGGDPLKDRQDERAAATVDNLADRYVAEHLPRLSDGSRRNVEDHLRMWVRPTLGKLKVKAVEHADVDRLHRKITNHGTATTANRVLSMLSKMFNLAILWKMRTDNPVRGVERNPEQPRHRYLSVDEMARLMSALAARPGRSADAIRLLLLTGARRGEILSATWDQFDLGEGVWTKPSAHTKQKLLHRVPLSAPARQVLAGMVERDAAEPDAFLFPAPRGRSAGQHSLKTFWHRVCRDAGIVGVRVHDLRHSYASTLAGAGLSLPIIGALLGHTQAQTTMRYAHLADAALRAATEHVGRSVVAAEKGGEGGAEVHTLAGRGRS